MRLKFKTFNKSNLLNQELKNQSKGEHPGLGLTWFHLICWREGLFTGAYFAEIPAVFQSKVPFPDQCAFLFSW